jgi:hypothetical protein
MDLHPRCGVLRHRLRPTLWRVSVGPSKSDKARFYQMALASLDETHYHLRLAHDLEYADTKGLRAQVDEIGRMLNAYTQAVLASARSFRTPGTTLLAFFSLLASRF